MPYEADVPDHQLEAAGVGPVHLAGACHKWMSPDHWQITNNRQHRRRCRQIAKQDANTIIRMLPIRTGRWQTAQQLHCMDVQFMPYAQHMPAAAAARMPRVVDAAVQTRMVTFSAVSAGAHFTNGLPRYILEHHSPLHQPRMPKSMQQTAWKLQQTLGNC